MLPTSGAAPAPGRNDLTDLQAVRSKDIALLAVGIGNQGNTGRTVRVVLDGLDRSAHVVLISLEVDDTVHFLVTASDVADGHLAAVVAAARAFQRGKQRLLRCRRSNIVEGADHFVTGTRGHGFELLYCHRF